MDHTDARFGQEVTPESEDVENQKTENNDNMAALLEQEGIGIDFPTHGEIRQGVIASIGQGQILVSIGAKSEGIIKGKEFEVISPDDLESLKIGQEIPVYIVNPEDQQGNLVLSFNRAQEAMAWRVAEDLLVSKDSFESKIIGYNKGGLLVPMGTLRGFVPASQVSLSRRVNLSGDTPEERWSNMVGEEIEVCVIEVDQTRRRLILSERAASSETRESIKDKVIDDLQEGDIRTGRVTSLADFGAFVNVSGADGLVHLSEVSWDRIQHPKEILNVGQEVQVKVITIDRDKKRIGLSIRQLQEDPWATRLDKYQTGQLIEGTITRLTKFGAFAQLEEDLEGLIHISEISEKRIEHPKEVLHDGDVVTLRVIKIDPENHRIGLSIRRVDSMAYADMDWQTLLDEDISLEDIDEDLDAEHVEESVVKDTKMEDVSEEPKSEEEQEVKAEPETETQAVEAAEEIETGVEAEEPPAEPETETQAVEAAEEIEIGVEAEEPPAEPETETQTVEAAEDIDIGVEAEEPPAEPDVDQEEPAETVAGPVEPDAGELPAEDQED
ncbi:MAG: S1 RNA-binding domain-containing protein [Anaerolineaceae bacterium]|nr:S1 RNA-binding domain-containing protein [Anaerolineaceae bacterium]